MGFELRDRRSRGWLGRFAMSFFRLEDLVVATVLAIVAVVSAWALTDADDVSPLLSSATVTMERDTAADEHDLAVAAPPEVPVAARPGAQRVCPCRAGRVDHTRGVPLHSGLPPRPSFLDGDGSHDSGGPAAKCQTNGYYQR
jgi:hypothetical protein